MGCHLWFLHGVCMLFFCFNSLCMVFIWLLYGCLFHVFVWYLKGSSTVVYVCFIWIVLWYSPTLKNEIKWGTYVVKFHFLISFLSVCLCVYTSNKPVIAVQSYTCLMQGATWVLGGRLPTKTPAGICETLWLARMHVPAF